MACRDITKVFNDVFSKPRSNLTMCLLNSLYFETLNYKDCVRLLASYAFRSNELKNLVGFFANWVDNAGLLMTPEDEIKCIKTYYGDIDTEKVIETVKEAKNIIMRIIGQQKSHVEICQILQDALVNTVNLDTLSFKARLYLLGYLVERNSIVITRLREVNELILKFIPYKENYSFIYALLQSHLADKYLELFPECIVSLKAQSCAYSLCRGQQFLCIDIYSTIVRSIVQYAQQGSRDHYRHAAALILNPLIFKTLTVEELIVSKGLNHILLAKNWGSKQNIKRNKVIHAEVDAMVRASQHPLLCHLFSSTAIQDCQNSKHPYRHNYELKKEAEQAIEQYLAEHNELIDSTSNKKLRINLPDHNVLQPLLIIIVELANNGYGFDSSQACPNCTKALIRWNIGLQCYSIDNENLFKQEVIYANSELSAETLTCVLNSEGEFTD